MSALELQPVCLLCGEHFSGPGVGIFGVGLVFECERAPSGSLGFAFDLGDLKPPTALAFAPNPPANPWDGFAGKAMLGGVDVTLVADPGDEDDSAERAHTAAQLAAWRTLTAALTDLVNISVPGTP